jgi:L-aspartate oxidase
LDLDDVMRSMKSLAWRRLGVFRDGAGLAEAEGTLAGWDKYVGSERFQMRRGFEMQNLLLLGKAAAHSALLREESRGAHQRSDFPNLSPDAPKHTRLTRDSMD